MAELKLVRRNLQIGNLTLQTEAENVWKVTHKFIELDPKKGEGCELDEFQAHKALEAFGETLTVIQVITCDFFFVNFFSSEKNLERSTPTQMEKWRFLNILLSNTPKPFKQFLSLHKEITPLRLVNYIRVNDFS